MIPTRRITQIDAADVSALSPLSAIAGRVEDLDHALIPEGTLVELGGEASLALVAATTAAAQERRELVAWVWCGPGAPHPEDLEQAGINLDALPFVRVDSARAGRAAELLLASGGFDLVSVIDCGPLRVAAVARLQAMARRHRSRLIVVPQQGVTLGATIALRLSASIRPSSPSSSQGAIIECRWTKNKTGQASSSLQFAARGPAGMTFGLLQPHQKRHLTPEVPILSREPRDRMAALPESPLPMNSERLRLLVPQGASDVPPSPVHPAPRSEVSIEEAS